MRPSPASPAAATTPEHAAGQQPAAQGIDLHVRQITGRDQRRLQDERGRRGSPPAAAHRPRPQVLRADPETGKSPGQAITTRSTQWPSRVTVRSSRATARLDQVLGPLPFGCSRRWRTAPGRSDIGRRCRHHAGFGDRGRRPRPRPRASNSRMACNPLLAEIVGEAVDVQADVALHHCLIHLLGMLARTLFPASGWVSTADAGRDGPSMAARTSGAVRRATMQPSGMGSPVVASTRRRILDTMQAALLVSEAAFVDDHAAVHLATGGGVHDPVEAHHHQVEAVRAVQPQQQGRGGVLPGDGDPPLLTGPPRSPAVMSNGPPQPRWGRAGVEQRRSGRAHGRARGGKSCSRPAALRGPRHSGFPHPPAPAKAAPCRSIRPCTRPLKM